MFSSNILVIQSVTCVAGSQEHPYQEEKCAYTEGRNVTWALRNKRPEKVKDSLKEVEVRLSSASSLGCSVTTLLPVN